MPRWLFQHGMYDWQALPGNFTVYRIHFLIPVPGSYP